MNLNDYTSLVTYRNSMKEKYMAYLELILSHPLGLAACTDSMLYAFDLDNAAGVNLDIIGDLVGIDRLLNFKPSEGSREMNDDEYRTMIRLKIAQNVWDGRNGSILEIYQKVFPEWNISYKDNQDMTISVDVYGVMSARMIDIFAKSGCFLIPAGVRYALVVHGDPTTTVLYVGVAQHGETIIDRIIVTMQTWGQKLQEQVTWNDAKEITWRDFLQSRE